MHLDTQHIQVSINFEDAHALSLGVLDLMEQDDVSVGLGIAALGLCLARLLALAPLDAPTEAKFVTDLMEWGGAYWAGGGSN